jgi:7-cyano-7-deazaguanine synthase
MKKAVVLLSGGLDSATVAAMAIDDGEEVIALTVDYGQKNVRELRSAEHLVGAMGIREHLTIEADLGGWCCSDLMRGASSPGDGEPPDGASPHRYYVPGRNAVLLAMALSLAEARDAGTVHLGFTAADLHYPDTQQPFLDAFGSVAALLSPPGRPSTKLVAPLIGKHKVAIVAIALDLGVPIEETWSCYGCGEAHCGACNACRVRDHALIKAGRPDLATLVGRRLYREGQEEAGRLFWRFALRP